MTPDAIAKARERMAQLKFHPRDALPNATALDRAEALYVDLRGAERSALGDLIAAFRAAIDVQDMAAIETLRGRLVTFVQKHR
jgi:molecular chaperone HscC